MNKANGVKAVKLFFYLAIAILGIYMTFFREEKSKEKISVHESDSVKENQEKTMIFEQAQKLGSLPLYENESSSELATQGIVEQIYFANTTVIDEGKLPTEVHAVLVSTAQKYLNRSGLEDVTELYIDEESYIEDEHGIAFNCYMDGYSKQLRIVYERVEGNLKFSILEE